MVLSLGGLFWYAPGASGLPVFSMPWEGSEESPPTIERVDPPAPEAAEEPVLRPDADGGEADLQSLQ